MRTSFPRYTLSLASLVFLCLACDSSSPASQDAAPLTDAPAGDTPLADAPAADASLADTPAVDVPVSGDTTPRAVASAQAMLAALSEAQRAAASFAYDDAAQRTRWSNFPTGIFQRRGVKLGDLTQAQKDAVFNLLSVILSPRGYQQVRDTIDADEALRLSSGGGMLTFGAAEYYVSIRGTPSLTAPWAVQFGGHHLAINATVVGANITLAPSLTGAQPTSFMRDGATVRVQGAEVDAAFRLIGMLTADQLRTAVIGTAFMDLALGPGQDGRVLAPEGIRASALTAAQQAALVDLIRERVGLINDEDGTPRMADIQSRLADTYFAWSGPTAPGSAAYWRITGPTLAIEYSPQSMGGAATNHTHAMYRDPTNDYGAAFPR